MLFCIHVCSRDIFHDNKKYVQSRGRICDRYSMFANKKYFFSITFLIYSFSWKNTKFPSFQFFFKNIKKILVSAKILKKGSVSRLRLYPKITNIHKLPLNSLKILANAMIFMKIQRSPSNLSSD